MSLKKIKLKPRGKPAAGGKSRASSLTPQARIEIAKRAAQARWSKEKSVDGGITSNLYDNELSKSGAPEYIIHKADKPKADNFEQSTGTIGDKRLVISKEKQWENYNSIDFKTAPLIVVGSLLRHPNLIRVAYELFIENIKQCVVDGKIARWVMLDYNNAYKTKADLKNVGALVLDNAHLEMDSKKFTLCQDYLSNDSITRIVVAHGSDPLEFSLSVLRHKPDFVFNVSVRERALKTINI